MKEKKAIKLGSGLGYLVTLGIGFALYFLTRNLPSLTNKLAYGDIVEGIFEHHIYKACWFFMDFTEATFFAGVFASIFMIAGGAIAWYMAAKGSDKLFFPICYGMGRIWPWILGAQCLSLVLTLFVFRYIVLFEDAAWIPSFLVTVSAPSAVLMLYGPSIPTLLTGSVLSAIICVPLATWCINVVVPLLQMPAGYGGLLTMVLMSFLVCTICLYLPWIKKREVKPYPTYERKKDIYSAGWSVRRTFADFSEPMFYGSEIVGVLMIVGVLVDYSINHDHVANGGGALLPAILLSQFAASGTGVFLYASKWEEYGWFGTFIPVVSVGPFCVLTYGGSIGAAVLGGLLGGVLCGPAAHTIAKYLPQGTHSFVASICAMLITTPPVLAVVGMFF